MKLDEIKGIKFPLQFGADGRVAMSSGEQHLKEAIAQVLMSATGELAFWPGFGSEIPKRIFSPVNRSAMLQADAREAITALIPRVEIVEIKQFATEKMSAGVMGYAVTFRYKGNAQAQTITIGQRV